MLKIDNLHVEVGGKEVLHGINLEIKEGETHVLLGPNGSGKSTLLMTIMGFANYTVTRGNIIFKETDITNTSANERAELGMGIMFQRPPTISGLKLGKLLQVIADKDADRIEGLAKSINMGDFLKRDINLGFSGGEIKRSELLQLMIQNPEFIMLDEPESGVDLENIHLIGKSIAGLLQKDQHIVNRKNSGLIITHTGYILDYLDADQGHVMINGEIRCHGNPREILREVQKRGYQECEICHQSN